MRYFVGFIALLLALTAITKSVLASETASKEFSNFGNWKIAAVHAVPMGNHWCNAVGNIDGYEVAISLDSFSPKYGKLALFVSPFPKKYIRGGDPRPCATGQATDAPAGALRFNMAIRSTEICDGVHDWHALKEIEESATLLLDGTAMASGRIRGDSDTVDGKDVVLSSYADFTHLDGIKEKLRKTETIEIRTTEENFPPILLIDLNLKRVMADLQRCQDSFKIKTP